MAKIYFEKLTELLASLNLDEEINGDIEIKHFFSGAAVYINGVLSVSWSPVGLAFKLSEQEVGSLIKSGKAVALKYFPKGHIKKGYVLFSNPESKKNIYWKKYFISSSQQIM